MKYTMEKLENELTLAHARWIKLYKYGGYDPFYADGMGLNLSRNHIIYFKRLMEELMEEEKTTRLFSSNEFPEIYYREIPPEMDYNYMANPEAIRERAREQIALYEQDENFKYLVNIKDTLFPDHQRTRELKHTNLPYYPLMQLVNYKKSYEEDDLVSMLREFHTDYEKKKEDWKQYVEEIKSFLAKENPENDILPTEDKKEPLESKIDRLTANNTTSEPKSSKQKDTNKEKLFQKEEQLSLF